jgi:hypothetical protein
VSVPCVELKWDPSDPSDPGCCIEVVVGNPEDVLQRWHADGPECPEPIKMKALLDTGAAVTIISKIFAKHCRLIQTGEGKIRALGAPHLCGEYAGAIRFPETILRPIDTIRILSADFIQEPHYACLIGRDVLRNWRITFDGPSKRVTIVD